MFNSYIGKITKFNDKDKKYLIIKNNIEKIASTMNKDEIELRKERVQNKIEYLKSPFLSILITLVTMVFATITPPFTEWVSNNLEIENMDPGIVKVVATFLYMLLVYTIFSIISLRRATEFEYFNIYFNVLDETKGINNKTNSKEEILDKRKTIKNKYFEEYKKQIIIVASMLALVIILILPISAAHPFMNPLIHKVFKGSESAIEYMQYFGTVVGGLATLIAVYITVLQTRKIQDENNVQIKIANINEKIKDYKDIRSSINVAKNIFNSIYFKYSKEKSIAKDQLINIFNELQKIDDIISEYKNNIILQENNIEFDNIIDKYIKLVYDQNPPILLENKETFVAINELIHEFDKKENQIIECINKLYKEKYDKLK